MDFGITLPTPADSWKTVKRAEDAGFSTAWFYDTQVLSADIFVAMGAAAVKTDRIRLGTGVPIPSNRIVPVTANGLASLNALAPGRIRAGFGTGFTGRRSIGLGPYKVSDMGDYIRAVTAMLRGETPELLIEGKARKVGFLPAWALMVLTGILIRKGGIINQALIIALALLFSSVASAHSWYPELCCGGKNCEPVKKIVKLANGVKKVTTVSGLEVYVPITMTPMPSQDGQIHVCYISEIPGIEVFTPRCYFEPGTS